MTTLIFPNSPTPNNGDTYTGPNGVLYTYYDGKWVGSIAGSGGGGGTPGGNYLEFTPTTY